jgi:hypothetical protein
MAYNPQLSMKSSRTLRRIAWALNIPMTRAIEEIFDFIGRTLDGKKICKEGGEQYRLPPFLRFNKRKTS